VIVAPRLLITPTSPAQAPTSAHPTLSAGATGAAVEELQRQLNRWITATQPAGLAPLVVDGIFGPRTAAAVRAYQRAHGLVVDGIAGPRTWASLGQ
jgi:peptidoglycan hydrolase-like protein with peptidoglycan-binding domain